MHQSAASSCVAEPPGNSPFHANTPANNTQSAVKMKPKFFHTNGKRTLARGMARKRRFSASFSGWVHSRARKEGMVNIQIDHIPINRAISGSSDGKMTLKDSNPPTTRATQACTSNTVYNTLPLYAGFFVAPDALGANVVAAFLANLVTSLSRSTSSTLFISCLSATNHSQAK